MTWMLLSFILCVDFIAWFYYVVDCSVSFGCYFQSINQCLYISLNPILVFYLHVRCLVSKWCDAMWCNLMNWTGSVVSMGGCSLALTMILYLTEALYFRSSTLTFYVIFPCVLNCKFFTLFLFILLLSHYELWNANIVWFFL